MSKDNKYYVPDVSEFYHGFEYEELHHDEDTFEDIYKKTVFPNSYVLTDDGNNNPNLIEYFTSNLKYTRVKYIDEEDIESLGFEQIGQENYYYKGNVKNWQLERMGTKKKGDEKVLYRLNTYDNHQLLFIELKNKSELIKLLKQLKIT